MKIPYNISQQDKIPTYKLKMTYLEKISTEGHKKDLSKWCFLKRSLNIMEMSFLPKLIYKFKTTTISMPTGCFCDSMK